MSAQGKTVSFKVETFRRLPDPVEPDKRERYYALCDVEQLPRDLPTDTNPRLQNTNTKVARKIREGLLGSFGRMFHLLNRGLLLSAESAEFDNKTSMLTIRMPNGECHGLVDGGHTYRIILEEIENLPLKQFVTLEIMTGIQDDFTNVAGARNTSVQVQEKALADLEHKLDVIKRIVAPERFADDVAYKQFDDREIDVLDVIAILTMFNIDLYADPSSHPIFCYSSKGRSLQVYLDENKRDTYAKLGNIAHDIFSLHDHIHRTFAEKYQDGTGGHLGKRKEIPVRAEPHYPLKFTKGATGFERIRYEIPAGFVYPILGAMRFLVAQDDAKSEFQWKVPNLIEFYDAHVGQDLVRTTMEASMDYGQNPQAVGKSRRHWESLYNVVAIKYLQAYGA